MTGQQKGDRESERFRKTDTQTDRYIGIQNNIYIDTKNKQLKIHR